MSEVIHAYPVRHTPLALALSPMLTERHDPFGRLIARYPQQGGSITRLRSTLDNAATKEHRPSPPPPELVVPMLQDLLRWCDQEKADLERSRATLLDQIDGFRKVIGEFGVQAVWQGDTE